MSHEIYFGVRTSGGVWCGIYNDRDMAEEQAQENPDLEVVPLIEVTEDVGYLSPLKFED